ncbi:MAG: hypothetical protein AAF743_14220 [Planctomycetota bacterium]
MIIGGDGIVWAILILGVIAGVIFTLIGALFIALTIVIPVLLTEQQKRREAAEETEMNP